MSPPPSGLTRRLWLAMAAAKLGVAICASATSTAQAARWPLVEVWKDPNCGCCKLWVEHLQENGFSMRVYATGNSAVRARLGIPRGLGSCHTALVAGYAIEGHVPASEIQRLLRERPSALGLAVPGMPVGSPGKDGPAYGNRRDAYDVLLVLRDGSTGRFRHYPAIPAVPAGMRS